MKSKSFRILILTVAVLIIAGGFLLYKNSTEKAEAAQSLFPPENVQKNSGQTTTTKIEWQWSAPSSGATPDYYLVYSGGGSYLGIAYFNGYTQNGLSVNTQYSIKVKSCTVTPDNCSVDFSSTAYGYTKAERPNLGTPSWSNYQLTFGWSANGNPSGTNYA